MHCIDCAHPLHSVQDAIESGQERCIRTATLLFTLLLTCLSNLERLHIQSGRLRLQFIQALNTWEHRAQFLLTCSVLASCSSSIVPTQSQLYLLWGPSRPWPRYGCAQVERAGPITLAEQSHAMRRMGAWRRNIGTPPHPITGMHMAMVLGLPSEHTHVLALWLNSSLLGCWHCRTHIHTGIHFLTCGAAPAS